MLSAYRTGSKEENMLKSDNKIFTVPNLLSAFRLVLIPVFVWLYCVKKEYLLTGVILIVSGLTDLADGFIARHFHATSDLGKILDPVADKLTQAAMLICLIFRFPLMLIPFLLLFVKEVFVGATGLLVIRKTGEVHGADMHGKIATTLLDVMMILHAFWLDIPESVSNVSIAVCVVSMAVSLVLYGMRNVRIIRSSR